MKKIPPIYCIPIATGNFKDKKIEYQCSACNKKWWSPNPPERNIFNCPVRIEQYANKFSKPSLIEILYNISISIYKKLNSYYLMYNPMALIRFYTRMKVCKSCPFYVPHLSQCRMCGCNMDIQTREISWKCPLGKWKGDPEPIPIKELFQKYGVNKDLKQLHPDDISEDLKSNEEFIDEIKSTVYKYLHNSDPPKGGGCNSCARGKKRKVENVS